MNKIAELFGIPCMGNQERLEIKRALDTQECPFTCKKCYKTRKSDSNAAIGTCIVWYQNQEIVICPARLLENHQVFLDCLHLLTLHEPGNELFLIPEITIPGGSVDFFLVSAKDGKVRDFAGIELQTLDTTGTVWPERQRLLHRYGFSVDSADLENQRTFGMNWKMTAKTILVQMHHKAETFERLNKHIALVIQEPFLAYISRSFSFSHVQGVRIGDSVHIHSYRLERKGGKLKLSLDNRMSTDAQGIAKCLGLHTSPQMEMKELTAALEKRLEEKYRLHVL